MREGSAQEDMPKHIPSISQCLEFIDRYEMLANIREHSIMVARVAGTLIDGLRQNGLAMAPLPDPAEVTAGALLHDIAKTLCLKTSCNHAEAGQRICIDLGYPEIGEIVAEHVILKTFAADRYNQGIFSAKELVFYADKRVLHDQVVPLSARLEYILEKYGDGSAVREQHIRLNFQRTLDLEQILFRFLDFTPETIVPMMFPEEII